MVFHCGSPFRVSHCGLPLGSPTGCQPQESSMGTLPLVPPVVHLLLGSLCSFIAVLLLESSVGGLSCHLRVSH